MLKIYWGRPSDGKTYTASDEAIDEMTSKKPKPVFSNYPISYVQPLSKISRIRNLIKHIWNKVIICNFSNRLPDFLPAVYPNIFESLVWKEEYSTMGLHDCKVIIDEAYRYKGLNCHDKMSVELHDFFATNAQDNNDIIVIAQHYNRISLILKEMADYYVHVTCTRNPLSTRSDGKDGGRKGQLKPLWFNMSFYTSEDEFKLSRMANVKVNIEKKRIWFNKNKTGSAYNTKAFRHKCRVEKPIGWTQEIYNRYCENKGDIKETDFEKGLQLML